MVLFRGIVIFYIRWSFFQKFRFKEKTGKYKLKNNNNKINLIRNDP